MAASTASQSGAGPDDKSDFANYAPGFVNRFRRLPGARSLAACSGLGALTAIIIGPFETGHFSLIDRTVFWVLAIAVTALTWRAWFALFVRSPHDWTRAIIFGGVAITAAMPLIVGGTLKVVGRDIGPYWWLVWPKSVGLALVIGGAVWLFARKRRVGVPIPRQGRLWRIGVTNPQDLLRVEAEDHYVRLVLSNDRNLLVHGRFSSILAELDAHDGCLVRRGCWVAAANVASIERDGRKLSVMTRDGHAITASPAGRDAMKQRGWI